MIIIALMFFAPEVVLIFGSKKYIDAIYVVPPVAASVFFIFLFNILIISTPNYLLQQKIPISEDFKLH